MANYTFKWQLEEKGFKEIPWEDWDNLYNGRLYKKKDFYVDNYLLPAVVQAKCGWEKVIYKIFKDNFGGYEEYIVLCYDSRNDDGRYINVSANSLGAIAQTVFDNIW